MSDVALLVIDVQESFRHRPFWIDAGIRRFTERLQALIDGAVARGIPVLQVFHLAETGPFSLESGRVRTLDPIVIAPSAIFHKRRHSALVDTGLAGWLTQHGIRRLIVWGSGPSSAARPPPATLPTAAGRWISSRRRR